MDRSEFKRYYQDERVVKYYKSEEYFENLVLRLQAEFLNNLILKRNSDLVLDLACGLGRVEQDLFGFRQGVALDSSQEMLSVARQLLGKKWIVVEGDVFNLNFQEEFFDLAYSFDFIDRFDISDRFLIYKQIFKVLKKNGLFVFDILDKEIKDIIENEINRNGFNILKIQSYIKYNSFKYFFKLLPETRAMRVAYKLEKQNGIGKPFGWLFLCERL
ncbi:MAG TPA: class I SAM-dependent methyltransferase [Candidatus Nanoarchaeia archaeon]|nr:class I SAM-dependent methyltransferase [Candidatus Woesearchaeota archaeon]HLD11188.1 class I SAM-dependent methyltransferase [Candidatus Nanoarchaeia archaeon]